MADRPSFINSGKREADDDGDKETSRLYKSTKTDSHIEIVKIKNKFVKTTEKPHTRK